MQRYTMTCGEAEFHRLLPMAFPGIAYDPALRRFTPPDAGWHLDLGAIGVIAIASVRMATIEVIFEFVSADPGRVLARFWLYFQRGGG